VSPQRATSKRARTRSELNARPVTAPDLPSDHQRLYRCSQCGDIVNRRQLGDVLLHAEPHTSSEQLGTGGLAFIEPMLPTLVMEPPAGDDWIHEIKYDGFRTQLIIDGSGVRAFTRNGFDWSGKYGRVLAAARSNEVRQRHPRWR
jgi:ATP-dependent DNA ligase